MLIVFNLVKVIVITTTALEGFKNELKKMVVALVDMERAFIPPQHFSDLELLVLEILKVTRPSRP